MVCINAARPMLQSCDTVCIMPLMPVTRTLTPAGFDMCGRHQCTLHVLVGMYAHGSVAADCYRHALAATCAVQSVTGRADPPYAAVIATAKQLRGPSSKPLAPGCLSCLDSQRRLLHELASLQGGSMHAGVLTTSLERWGLALIWIWLRLHSVMASYHARSPEVVCHQAVLDPTVPWPQALCKRCQHRGCIYITLSTVEKVGHRAAATTSEDTRAQSQSIEHDSCTRRTGAAHVPLHRAVTTCIPRRHIRQALR